MDQGAQKDSPQSKFKMYVVKGNPVALARTRIITENKCWDSQKQIKLSYGLQIQNQHSNRPLYAGPLRLNVVFFMPIAPSSRRKNLHGSFHYFRPDLDNCIKFLADVCTGILYHEDSLICSVAALKVYDNDPRTEFYITELMKQENTIDQEAINNLPWGKLGLSGIVTMGLHPELVEGSLDGNEEENIPE